MQNWDAMQSTVSYEQHNPWYQGMFSATIKTEPGTNSPPEMQSPAGTPPSATSTSQLETYLRQHAAQQQQRQQQQLASMETMCAMTPSPNQSDSLPHFFDAGAANGTSSSLPPHLLQQQQYQQQFQQAQQAAAQNQLTSTHLPLGFNPLTPPGLPTAVLPGMAHFYNNSHSNNNSSNGNNALDTHLRHGQQTPSPQPAEGVATPSAVVDKLQCALTPRNTPPMDITPPKSPKSNNNSKSADTSALEHEQDLISNSSENLKYLGADSDDDESIRMPIYNSHGKMKNYKCKTCGFVGYTKVSFWEHVRLHMKPEKILQCPKCPFATELKHHLEYHIRKHKNLKPFQCDKCAYTCVNKSMLNSHRKSHSSVYQYRCADCDYATKYCHSFKQHLRKYNHKPGTVLDEEGVPNPSIVIDVYGTRRGPKSKSGNGPSKRQGERERHVPDLKLTTSNTSQLSAALQGFPLPQGLASSPAKSCSSVNSDIPAIGLQKTLQQQQQNPPQLNSPQANVANLLPPLASILQQNRNMAFFPYWNLQFLAAQQQAAVLAQLSPRMREAALQQLQSGDKSQDESIHELEDQEDDEDFDRKSIDSAMDLSQGTPTKEELPPRQQPASTATAGANSNTSAVNLKVLAEESSDATPLVTSVGSSRRKGRVLKLDTLLQVKTAAQSPGNAADVDMPSRANSPTAKVDAPNANNGSSTDEEEVMEASAAKGAATANPSGAANAANTSASSTASTSSGNSSNSSNNSNSNGSSNASGAPAGAIYECKYCDIYFKDAVLYTIHMGYHSCDDVFKCNMCGEKCDGPVGLFVHMARNAHS